jgi:hypothetical protein
MFHFETNAALQAAFGITTFDDREFLPFLNHFDIGILRSFFSLLISKNKKTKISFE